MESLLSTYLRTTVGFGDFLAKKPVSRVLLFPFSLVGIALLGSLLSMIIGYFSDQSSDRKAVSRAEFERQRQEEENRQEEKPNLQREIAFLTEINEKQDFKDQVQEFTIATAGFAVFWLIGGAIFSAIEVGTVIASERPRY